MNEVWYAGMVVGYLLARPWLSLSLDFCEAAIGRAEKFIAEHHPTLHRAVTPAQVNASDPLEQQITLLRSSRAAGSRGGFIDAYNGLRVFCPAAKPKPAPQPATGAPA